VEKHTGFQLYKHDLRLNWPFLRGNDNVIEIVNLAQKTANSAITGPFWKTCGRTAAAALGGMFPARTISTPNAVIARRRGTTV
jgi:hypothetical protein